MNRCRTWIGLTFLALLTLPGVSHTSTARTGESDPPADSTHSSVPPALSVGQTTAPASSTPAELRGTTGPLVRHTSPLRHVARGPLWPLYAGFRLATWPVEHFLYLNEKHEILRRAGNLLTLDLGSYRTVIGPAGVFESSTGLAFLGASLSTRDWLGTGARLRLSGGYLSSSRNRVTFRINGRPGQFHFRLLGDLERQEDRPFYGIGPRSPNRRLAANHRRTVVEGTIGFQPPGRFRTALTAYVRDIDLDPPSSDDPVDPVFPDLAALSEESRYTGLEASAAFDSRNHGPYSTQGGLLEVTGGVNEARSAGDGDYRHYGAEGQYYINLYRHTRVLALRAFVEGVDADDPGSLPYTELERIGGRTGPRGYSRFRFTDRNSLALTLEYRYRITEHVRFHLFSDWGTVAAEWNRLRLADTDPIFGCAIGVASSVLPLIVQVSQSPETTEVYVGLTSIFSDHSRRLR